MINTPTPDVILPGPFVCLLPRADAELQHSSVRGGEEFTAAFTFWHDHLFKNFQLN